jgi:hypothetical protein
MSKNSAPYGLRKDGKPKKKPGRKSDKERVRLAAKRQSRASTPTIF